MDKLIFIIASSNSLKTVSLSELLRIGSQLFLIFSHLTNIVVKPVKKVNYIQ